MTIPELSRAVREIRRTQDQLVTKELYERDIREIHEDTGEIKDTLKWAMRLLVGQFLGLVIALLFFALNRIPI